jgi:hypothetical protein
MDYTANWQILEDSANPFATLIMAHLKTKATRHNPSGRLDWKLRLVKRLYEKRYQREDVLEIFRFIKWLLKMPPELEHFPINYARSRHCQSSFCIRLA